MPLVLYLPKTLFTCTNVMIRADVNISDQGWWKGSFAGFFGYRRDVPFFTLLYIESRDLWLPLRVPLPNCSTVCWVKVLQVTDYNRPLTSYCCHVFQCFRHAYLCHQICVHRCLIHLYSGSFSLWEVVTGLSLSVSLHTKLYLVSKTLGWQESCLRDDQRWQTHG